MCKKVEFYHLLARLTIAYLITNTQSSVHTSINSCIPQGHLKQHTRAHMQLRYFLNFFSFKSSCKGLISFYLVLFLMTLKVTNLYFLLFNSDTLSTIVLIGTMLLMNIRLLISCTYWSKGPQSNCQDTATIMYSIVLDMCR
jgi:hypothetical protein